MPRDPGPYRESRTLAPRPQTPRELLLAQFPQEVRQGYFNRAHDTALIAERGRVRQVERLVETDVRWRQNGAHRARVDPAVRMSADALVDRAVVHARATAYAAQHRLHIGAKELAASAVDQDHVKVLRSFHVFRASRPCRNRDVIRDRLTRPVTRQKP